MCGMTKDSFGDHALTCGSHGDRTVRHNTLCNVVYKAAPKANLTEKEKAGLLPNRPAENRLSGHMHSGPTRQRQLRRLSDVFLSRLSSSGPTALDPACTSGLRSDQIQTAADSPGLVTTRYEDWKSSSPPGETQTRVSAASSSFASCRSFSRRTAAPWGRTLEQSLLRSRSTQTRPAARTIIYDSSSLHLAQRLSVAFRKENVRAIVRRRRESP